jgi:hypothetical protein
MDASLPGHDSLDVRLVEADLAVRQLDVRQHAGTGQPYCSPWPVSKERVNLRWR